MPATTAQLKAEYAQRAEALGLSIDCPADGTFNAQIAIIAEAPGDVELVKKLPLIGPSGFKLWATLRQFGLHRMDCYITNVSKRQVSTNDEDRKNKRVMAKPEFSLWKDLVLWELSQLPNLKYVLALGNFALEALTGKTGISHWRGSVLDAELLDRRQVKVVCTYNPAMILREPRTEIMFQMDCGKLKRVIEGKYRLPIINTHINPSYKEAMEWIDKMRREGLPVAWDIETHHNETACHGYANSVNEAMCINWTDGSKNRYTVAEERGLRRNIQRLHKDERVRLVTQNGMFDSTWIWYKDRISTGKIWFDTMLAHHALYPTLPHNLGFITTQYTDHPYYKDEKDDWRAFGSIDEYWRYNGKDCCNTLAGSQKLLRELEKQELDKFFFEHIMRLQPLLAKMTITGVLMDTSLKEKISNELAETVASKLAAFHAAVQDATGLPEYAPNPRSPKQVSELLFKRLKLVGRGTSTAVENRKRMFSHPRTTDLAKKVITALDDYATDNKYYTTYAEIELDEDGRCRCEYKQTGVQSAPGRLSSAAVMWGSGCNLQNIPSRAHEMFIADEGFGLSYYDAAQAEARLVAYFANIAIWKEQFERARIDGTYDAHRALAADMFGIPYEDIPADDEIIHPDGSRTKTLRFVSKRCRHGLNYRMMPDRLAQTTGLPISEAYRAYNAYHRATPELRKWWAAVEREVRNEKFLYNAYGRRWALLERISPEALESIIAFKPQSTLGDHVCRVMYQSESDSRWPAHARIWLNNHDALIALAPVDKLKTCCSIMKEYQEKPIYINGEELIIPADTKISYPDEHGVHRWSTLKKWKVGE
jgi:uracil-DNA glycosylase family 4